MNKKKKIRKEWANVATREDMHPETPEFALDMLDLGNAREAAINGDPEPLIE